MTPHDLLREQLNDAIQCGDLTAVAGIVYSCKAEKPGSRMHFDTFFAPPMLDQRNAAPLHRAIAARQAAIALHLIEQGCDIAYRDKNGATPLFNAFDKKQFEVADRLIAAGADIHATNDAGTRVFDAVLASGKRDHVDWFLEQGLTLTYANSGGTTALHFACRSGDRDLAFEVHERSGIGFDQPNRPGRRPIDWCSDYALFQAILARYPAIAPGIDIGASSTSLLEFALRGQRDIVRHLLDAGHDATRLAIDHGSILHCAVRSGNAGLVADLLQRKVKLEVRDDYAYSAMHYAARNGKLDIVRLLVDAGAKVNVKGSENFITVATRTPLSLAVANGHADVARFLVDHGADPNVLIGQLSDTATCLAAELGDAALLRYLLDHGASPNGINRDPDAREPDFTYAPLCFAASAEIVGLLVDHGADINAALHSHVGAGTPLRHMVASLHKHELTTEAGRARLGAIAAMLRHGARTRDKYGHVIEGVRCAEVLRVLRDTPSCDAPVDDSDLYSAMYKLLDGCKTTAVVEAVLEALKLPGPEGVGDKLLFQLLSRSGVYSKDSYAPLAMLRHCAQRMLALGATPHIPFDYHQETAFHAAALLACDTYGNSEGDDDDATITGLLDDLLDAGGDPNCANRYGAHVIDLLRHPQLIARLRARGADFGATPCVLFNAIRTGDPDTVDALIGGATNRMGRNEDGLSLLDTWAGRWTDDPEWPGALRTVQLLEQHGFVINAPGPGNALMLACTAGAIVQAQWLLEQYEWDLNEQDRNGATALPYLVAADFPGSRDEGMTAKQFRTRRDALAVQMVRQGARIDLADADGGTALSRCTTAALRKALERAAVRSFS